MGKITMKDRIVLEIEMMPSRMNIAMLATLKAVKGQFKAQQDIARRQKEERLCQEKQINSLTIPE